MSVKRITSPLSKVMRLRPFKNQSVLQVQMAKQISYQSNKHQLTYATDQRQLNCLTNKVLIKNRDSNDRKQIINQLLQENIKLQEQNDKNNRLIEMLIDERTDIKRVTSFHISHEKDIQQSKTNFRLQSPNKMEFTFYKSPSRGLPKEFLITPSRKMFF